MSSDSQPTPLRGKPGQPWMILGICAALVALVWAVYGQVSGFEFVNYDDAPNVAANPQITAGLSIGGFFGAFLHSQVGRWAPLAALSHMADCQFFGLNAGAHHLVNAALHALAAVLLFIALLDMTGAPWRSAFVAAIFTVHPLRVEAVAWVSERGDLLAGVFFLLALLAYTRYARGPSAVRRRTVAALFALGLMCKASIIMLPFLLLLLDRWPLDRFTKLNGEPLWLRIPRHLVVEKIPLFALSLLSCLSAVLAQRAARTPIENLPLFARLGNAPVACAIYLRQMVWPFGLAAFYPHPKGSLPAWQVLASLALLAGISLAVFAARRRFRYAPAGWCWYLVMLLPMLGLFETGEQGHADRYTCIPLIGVYILLAWGAADLSAKWEGRREILAVSAALALMLLALRARDQAFTWRDSVTLWNNAVEATGPNAVAQDNLGSALLRAGRMDEAFAHIRAALDIDPGREEAHISMGNLLLESGRAGDAIAEYRRAVQLHPDSPGAHLSLGNALLTAQLPYDAISEYRRALDLDPGFALAHGNLGEAYRRIGRIDDAIGEFHKALELDPGDAPARGNLNIALQQKAAQDGN